MSTWIRFTQVATGQPRSDVSALELTDEQARELAEQVAAVMTSTSGQLTKFEEWPEGTKHCVLYVRAAPASALARQDRDLVLGAELIRRFDLTPHIVMHLAVDRGKPYREGRRTYPFDWNGTGTTACGTYVVNTHMADDLNEVTCKACRATAQPEAGEDPFVPRLRPTTTGGIL